MATLHKRKAAFGAICFVIAGSVALYFLSVPKHWPPQRAGSTAELAEAFGGGEVVSAIREANEAIAYQISDEKSAPTTRRADPLDYKIIDGPRTVVPIQIDELKSALLEPDSYRWNVTRLCTFNPGMRLTLRRGSDVIDILFCFSCDELYVYRNRIFVGRNYFDPSRAKFVAIAKRVFPNDQIIQALPERQKWGS